MAARFGLPASPAQERLWFLEQWDPGKATHHVAVALRLSGPLDLPRLERAVAETIRRHQPLRAGFESEEGRPLLVIAPPGDGVGLPVQDLTGRPDVADAAAGEEARRPFELSGPLFRARLLRLGPDRHVLCLTGHRLCVDRPSLGVLAAEVGATYRAPEAGVGPRSEAGEPPAARDPDVGERLRWWRDRLAGLPPLEVPADRPRPAVFGHLGATVRRRMPAEAATRLRDLAASAGVSTFEVVHTALAVLLARYTGQDDLAVGAERRPPGTPATAIGPFAGPVVLRLDASGNPAFRDLLDRARAALEEAEASHVAFDLVVEELQPDRDPSRNPLFQVSLEVLDREPAGHGLGWAGLDVLPVEVELGAARWDLHLEVTVGRDVTLAAQHSVELFDRPRIERLLAHLDRILMAAAGDPSLRLGDLPLLSSAGEEERVLRTFGVAAAAPAATPIHELVAEQAARAPDAEAVVAIDGALTRAGLESRANRLARLLRDAGAGPGTLVAVALHRRLDLPVAVLAVLKAGAAYVPLDPAYPPDRLAFMVEDSGASVLVTSEPVLPRLPQVSPAAVVCVDRERAAVDARPDAPPPGGAGLDDLAYVLYTSGSTGRPKGVAIGHRSVAALAAWAADAFGPERLERVLATSSICFDLSVFEVLVPLAVGGSVVLVENLPSLAPEPGIARDVTLVNTVPSVLAELFKAGGLPDSVRTVNLAGEPLPPALVGEVFARTRAREVFNLYGPSEDTTYSTAKRLPRDSTEVTIGRPVTNTRAYVLDRWGRPAPVGVPGQLHLAGLGLALGYLRRPDLTAERFVPDPFSPVPGGRMYATGDLARWREDGELEYLGRIDHQVKVRGLRIELGEVEAAVASDPSVAEAVVAVKEDEAGERRLVAYVIPADPAAGENGMPGADGARGVPAAAVADLRAACRRVLPDYMVPSAFVWVESFPLSPNGKVDRRALPSPERVRERPQAHVAPSTDTERTLAALWAPALGLDRVGATDDFFELGGHSLLATRIMSEVRREFGVELSLRSMFDAPTLSAMARLIEDTMLEAAARTDVASLLQLLEAHDG